MPLAGVKTSSGFVAVVALLRPARKPVSTVTALEDLQAVGAFPSVLGAHLPFLQDRLADLGPKVTCTA